MISGVTLTDIYQYKSPPPPPTGGGGGGGGGHIPQKMEGFL